MPIFDVLVLNRTDAVSYDRGDIIMVRPHGHKWGSNECPPIFRIVQVDASSIEDIEQYLSNVMETVVDEIEVYGKNFNPDNLPGDMFDKNVVPTKTSEWTEDVLMDIEELSPGENDVLIELRAEQVISEVFDAGAKIKEKKEKIVAGEDGNLVSKKIAVIEGKAKKAKWRVGKLNQKHKRRYKIVDNIEHNTSLSLAEFQQNLTDKVT